jgi:hypothetical protein
LAAYYEKRTEKPLPAARTAFFSFVKEKTGKEQAPGFLELCREYLAVTRPAAVIRPTASSRRTNYSRSPIGALIQPFCENGQWQAVVNGLYAGGGKLFARWLPLFSQDVARALQSWCSSMETQFLTLQFPWQGYFNANCQPRLLADTLLVPGGRVRPLAGAKRYRLGDLEVCWENGMPELRDRSSGQQLSLTDLGLEANETRPPVMQLLWLLGVPYVSLEQLLPDDQWGVLANQIRHRPRIQRQNLVLARATWVLEPETWQGWVLPAETEVVFFEKIRNVLTELAVPRHFFARFESTQPQYFDLDSPLFMQLFRKELRRGRGALVLTEMLPVPEGRAVELVAEFFSQP